MGLTDDGECNPPFAKGPIEGEQIGNVGKTNQQGTQLQLLREH
jgi:hypothetical protein